MSFSGLIDRLTGGPRVDPHFGWSPDCVAEFVPWPKRKPASSQKLYAPTSFVETQYERSRENPELFVIYVSPSFGTGYGYLASGSESCVDKLTLRLEGAERDVRDTTIEEFIEIADRMTRLATSRPIPNRTLGVMRDRECSTSDHSHKRREIGPSRHGFNFSDFAAVAREPHFRAFVYEVFAPSLAEKW